MELSPGSWSRIAAATAATLISALVIAAEHTTSLSGTLWSLHLFSAALATWHVGRKAGIALAVVGVALGSVRVPDGALAEPVLAVALPEVLLRLGLLLISVLLLSALKGRLSEPDQLRVDPSSGLVNSQGFFAMVNLEVERSQRYGRPFTIAYLSVENLSIARHRGGHEGAEEVLRRVGHFIRGSLRNVDVVTHLREQEFAILLPESGAEAGRVVLNRLRRNLSVSADDDPSSLWFAIGAITWLESQVPVEQLHQRAYQLMYEARGDGSNLQHQILDEARVEPVPERRLVLHTEGTDTAEDQAGTP